mmetsp:Transcript_69379/g.201265  ORF Transcript_69379/g.201265 Transcript_69379/m.201265 type:complete len:243 (-) Transcript_69379:358-1086(-)
MGRSSWGGMRRPRCSTWRRRPRRSFGAWGSRRNTSSPTRLRAWRRGPFGWQRRPSTTSTWPPRRRSGSRTRRLPRRRRRRGPPKSLSITGRRWSRRELAQLCAISRRRSRRSKTRKNASQRPSAPAWRAGSCATKTAIPSESAATPDEGMAVPGTTTMKNRTPATHRRRRRTRCPWWTPRRRRSAVLRRRRCRCHRRGAPRATARGRSCTGRRRCPSAAARLRTDPRRRRRRRPRDLASGSV